MVKVFTDEDRAKALEIRRLAKQNRQNIPEIPDKIPPIPQNSLNSYRPTPIPQIDSLKVAQKREELELARMEAELKAIKEPTAPSSKLDYYDKMLELQAAHNTALLNMQKDQFELKLELEKLRQGGDPNSDWWMDMVEMALPMMMQKQSQAPPQSQSTKTPAEVQAPQGNSDSGEGLAKSTFPALGTQGGANIGPIEKLKLLQEARQLQEAIKAGKVTSDEVFNDLSTRFPQLAGKVTREQFEEIFQKVKRGENII